MRNFLRILSCVTLSVIGLQCCTQNANDEQIQIEQTAEDFIIEYSALFDDLSKNMLTACLNNKDLDVKEVADAYESNLTENEKNCFYRMVNPSVVTRSEKTLLPADLLDKLAIVMFDKDLDRLETEINSFYETPAFRQMSPEIQEELKIRLSCLINIRNSTTDILIACYTNNSTETRCSPGDRMIWSQAAEQMPEDMRRKAVDVDLYVIGACIGFVGGGPIFGAVYGLVTLLIGWL